MTDKLNRGDYSEIDDFYHDKYTYHGLGEIKLGVSSGKGKELLKESAIKNNTKFTSEAYNRKKLSNWSYPNGKELLKFNPKIIHLDNIFFGMSKKMWILFQNILGGKILV